MERSKLHFFLPEPSFKVTELFVDRETEKGNVASIFSCCEKRTCSLSFLLILRREAWRRVPQITRKY